MTKTVLKALSVPTVDFFRVNEEDYKKRGMFLLKSIGRRLQYPIIVKPSHLGSSIGIRIARDENELKSAIESAFTLDHRILLEKFLIHKTDVNCAAYAKGGEIFVSEPEIAFGAGVYSFEEKYVKRTGESGCSKNGILPKRERLEGELREKVRSYTKSVYKRMNLQGIVRIDFLISDGKVYLSEVNTVPGSLAYYLFCERISDARGLFSAVIEEALRVGKLQEKPLLTTGILSKNVKRK
jgi:D-alanine-D-alanine ligase